MESGDAATVLRRKASTRSGDIKLFRSVVSIELISMGIFIMAEQTSKESRVSAALAGDSS